MHEYMYEMRKETMLKRAKYHDKPESFRVRAKVDDGLPVGHRKYFKGEELDCVGGYIFWKGDYAGKGISRGFYSSSREFAFFCNGEDFYRVDVPKEELEKGLFE